jgi:biopolymer transport protein ExbD
MQLLNQSRSETLTPPIAGSGKTLLARVEDSLLPLINLVFLLLMFFIAVGQMSATPLPKLPNTQVQQSPKQPQADLVVKGSGDWSIDGKTIADAELLSALPTPDQEQPLRIAANQSIAMADMENLFRRLEKGGYKDIVLLVKPGP